MRRRLRIRPVQVWHVPVQLDHADLQVVRYDRCCHAGEEPERPLVRGDSVRQTLRPSRLNVSVVRRAQRYDEHLRLPRLAGPMRVALHHIDLPDKGPIMLAKPAVAEAVRMRRLVLLPP